MIAVYKYELRLGVQQIPMPIGAEVLTAQVQGTTVQMWCRIDTERPVGKRAIAVVGTGHDAPSDGAYVATFQLAGLVFHAFDGGYRDEANDKWPRER